MGCKSRQKTQTLVQIQKPLAKVAVASAPAIRNDYRCQECGNKRPHHKCPGEQIVSYVADRASHCYHCEHAQSDICKALRVKYPDRPCQISIGVRMQGVRCPIGKWERTLWRCDKCGSESFDERGLSKCPVCFPSQFQPKQLVQAPQFRPIPIEKHNPICVVSIAVGEQAIEMSRLTFKRLKEYATKCGADFIAIYDDQFPDYRLGNKFRLAQLSRHYRRILYLDADVWVTKSCPDLFSLLPDGFVWRHEDYEHLQQTEWLDAEASRIAQEQSVKPLPLRCLNSGVVLWDWTHRNLWRAPEKPFYPSHTAEQSWIEYNARDMRTGTLPTELNCQWWFRDFAERSKDAKILHLANCPHKERMEFLNRIAWEDR